MLQACDLLCDESCARRKQLVAAAGRKAVSSKRLAHEVRSPEELRG